MNLGSYKEAERQAVKLWNFKRKLWQVFLRASVWNRFSLDKRTRYFSACVLPISVSFGPSRENVWPPGSKNEKLLQPRQALTLVIVFFQELWLNVTMNWEIVTSCRSTASVLPSTWLRSALKSLTVQIQTPGRQTRPRAAPATPPQEGSASSGCGSPRVATSGWRSVPRTRWAWWSAAYKVTRACLPQPSAGFSQVGHWQTGCAWTNSTSPGTM